ncbi:VWA domain-containing protein [Candidatus Babeliales bacterium]|nr:VWA domain-containing protein [Candidatus Babeliales bacterium]
MIDGIYFANLDRIFLFPVFLFLGILFIKNFYRLKKTYFTLVSAKQSSKVFPGFSLRNQRLKLFLKLLSLGVLFIALLRPQWGKKDQHIVQEGRDLLIVLDVSRSMLAKDFKPNRLEFAKSKIRNLLEKLSFERVGLILFSGSAFISCPLTADYSAFKMFLNQVDAESISSGTTAFDKAFSRAVEVFSKQKQRKNKLVLFLTDGEDFSNSFEVVKTKSSSLGISLFALGIGSVGGAPVPILDQHGKQVGHEKDENNKPILSKLNEKLLQGICNNLGGAYFKASYDDSDLIMLVKNIEKFEKEKFEERTFSRFEDRYPWFLAAAWLFLLIEWLL